MEVKIVVENHASKLLAAMSALIEDGVFCDLAVKQVVASSMLLLTACSKMTSIQSIKDQLMLSPAAQHVVAFIHHRQVSLPDKHALFSLYELSHFLGVKDCEEACKEFLGQPTSKSGSILISASTDHNKKFMAALCENYTQRKHCDVQLEASDDSEKMISFRVNAHKLIIGAGAGYFKPLLEGRFDESESFVDLQDISKYDLLKLLNLIYNGEASIKSESNAVMQFYTLADRLCLLPSILSVLLKHLQVVLSLPDAVRLSSIEMPCPAALRAMALKKFLEDRGYFEQNAKPVHFACIADMEGAERSSWVSEDWLKFYVVQDLAEVLKSPGISMLGIDAMSRLLSPSQGWKLLIGKEMKPHFVLQANGTPYFLQERTCNSRPVFSTAKQDSYIFFSTEWVAAKSLSFPPEAVFRAQSSAGNPLKIESAWSKLDKSSWPGWQPSSANFVGVIQISSETLTHALITWSRDCREILHASVMHSRPDICRLQSLFLKVQTDRDHEEKQKKAHCMTNEFSAAFKKALCSEENALCKSCDLLQTPGHACDPLESAAEAIIKDSLSRLVKEKVSFSMGAGLECSLAACMRLLGEETHPLISGVAAKAASKHVEELPGIQMEPGILLRYLQYAELTAEDKHEYLIKLCNQSFHLLVNSLLSDGQQHLKHAIRDAMLSWNRSFCKKQDDDDDDGHGPKRRRLMTESLGPDDSAETNGMKGDSNSLTPK